MLNNLNSRYTNIESIQVLAQATYLDPRFKKNGFNQSDALQKCRANIQENLTRMEKEDKANSDGLPLPQKPMVASTSKPDAGIWSHFEEEVSKMKPSSTVSAILEMRQYAEEQLLPLKEDPLKWWKKRMLVYPNLSKMARKYLGIVATSVPSERIFSKAGELVSEKRNRLNPEHVQQILFLNANFDHI